MQKIKKIFSIFVLLFVVSLNLMGCDEKVDANFYYNTNAKFNEFVQSLCLNSDYSGGVMYEDNISSILQSIKRQGLTHSNAQRYTELETVYDSIFIASFHFLQAFSNSLSVAPTKITADVEQEYKDFENQIDITNAQFDVFNDVLHELDITVITSEPFGIISMQSLKDYKRSLIDLCQEIIKLDNMFISICEKYIYQTFDSFKGTDGNYLELNDTVIRNQKNLANLKSVVATITPAIEYLNAFDGEYTNLSTDKFFTTLNSYSQMEIADKNSKTATVEELDRFLQIYTYYQNDLQCFYTSLDNVNFVEFKNCNYDIEVFSQDDPQKFAYANKILSFSNQSVLNLYDINSKLCS